MDHVPGVLMARIRVGRKAVPSRLRRLLGRRSKGRTVVVLDRPPKSIHRDEHGLLVVDLGRNVAAREVSDAIGEDRAHRG